MTQSDWAERTNNGTSFVGSDVDIYAAHVLASGLRFYLKTGMRVNRAYTPKNMMRKAAEITGRTFRPRDYQGAADALDAWAHARKGEPRTR